MCGIVGAVGRQEPGLVAEMAGRVTHRGPDGSGCWSNGYATVASTRLAIVDPTSPAGPIHDESGRLTLVFNGEIYNHRWLRIGLERRGHVFRTGIDAEVVVHLYEEQGTRCVETLHGMYAFAIVDHDVVFLARDPLGIKPLCYAVLSDGETFLFASETKALFTCPRLEASLDEQTFADFVVLGHAVQGSTFMRGVRTLRSGHTLTVRRSPAGLVVGRETPVAASAAHIAEGMTISEAEDHVVAALGKAVASHLMGDIEVGITLSGGLDSTLLALFAANAVESPLRSFTMADDPSHPDATHAGRVAESLGLSHELVLVPFDEFVTALTRTTASLERPVGPSSAAFTLLCERIGRELKVCLNGEGADEMFGGYASYLDRQSRLKFAARRLPILERLGTQPSEAAMAQIHSLATAPTFASYLSTLFEIDQKDALERQHLDVVDRCSMAAGLEMRVPFLDDAVVAAARALPRHHLVRTDIGVGKYVLRRILMNRFGPDFLDIALREKLSAPSAGARHVARLRRIVSKRLPARYLENHERGFCFDSDLDLVMFELFLRVMVDRRGIPDTAGTVYDVIESSARL